MSENNIKIYSSYSSSLLIVLLPLIIGFTSSTNKEEGIIKGVVGIVALLVLPYLYTIYMSECKDKSTCFLEQSSNSLSSFLIMLVIIIIIMFMSSH